MNSRLICSLVLTTVYCLSTTQTSFAEAPAVTYLFPAGGKQGTEVVVTVAGKLGTAPVSIWASDSGITATVPEKPAKANQISVKIAKNAQPGIYWLRFHNAEGASDLRAFIVGTLTEALEKEPNNNLKEAQALEGSQLVVNGVLSKSGDVDTFAVSLQKGQTLVVSMEAHRNLASPMDGILQIVSERGFVLDQNDDLHGNDPQIAFTAPAAGKYYVRTFAFPAAPNSTLRFSGAASYVYRITFTTGPFADHTYPMATTADASSVKVFGWNIPAGLQQLPVTPARLVGGPQLHHGQLANALELRQVAGAVVVEAEANAGKKPQPINIPSTITGRIEATKEADSYTFQATKGQKVIFRAESKSFGSALDPYLRLFDSTGKLIREIDDTKRNSIECTLKYTFPADGAYRLQISDLYQHGSFRHVYRLGITEEKPDFQLTIAASKFILDGGKPLEIPVSVVRNDATSGNFTGEIEVSVVGLPAGVTAAVGKSTAKGDTSKTVKLTLKSTSEKHSTVRLPLSEKLQPINH